MAIFDCRTSADAGEPFDTPQTRAALAEIWERITACKPGWPCATPSELQDLQAQRTAALAAMKAAARDPAAFAVASRLEAELAAQIRRLTRGGVQS